MNGNKIRPPPPNRRPPPKAEFAGRKGQDLKGSSGNIQKFRGTVDISKIPREDNPNITSGVNLVVDINQGWSKVTKKGARETGLVSKELLKLAKNSTHTYFADNHSNAERAGNNRFSVLENDGFEPLDTLSQSFKGPDKGNGLLLDDQIAPSIMEKDLSSNVALANTSEGVQNFNMESNNIPNNMGHKPRMEAGLEVLNLNNRDIANKKDNMAVENASSKTDGFIENNKFIPSIGIGLPACPTNFIPQMSAIEVEINTHALYSRNSHTTDKALSSTTQCPLGPLALNQTLNHAQNYNTFNVGPQGYVNKEEYIGQNMSSSLIRGKGELVGDKLLSGANFVGDMEKGGIKGNNCGIFSDYIPPTLSIHTSQLEDSIGQFDFNGKLHGPTSKSLHAKKVDFPLQLLELDGNNFNGPNTHSSSYAATPSIMGPGVFLSPLINSAHTFNLDPPILLPSAPYDLPSPVDGSHTNLGQLCCLNVAQVCSSIPAQSSSAAIGSESNSSSPPTNLSNPSSPNLFITQAQSAMSSLSCPDDGSSAHNAVDPVPLATVYIIEEVGFNASSGGPFIAAAGHGNKSNTAQSIIASHEINIDPTHHGLPQVQLPDEKKFNAPINTSKKSETLKLGVDKFHKSPKKGVKSGKLVRTLLAKGGSQRHQNRSGVSKSSSHSTC